MLPPVSNIVPSFRAKSIDRTYLANLNVVLEIGGKRFEEKFRWSPVTFLTKEVDVAGKGDNVAAGLDKEPSMAIVGTDNGAERRFGASHGILEIVGDKLN